jgi:Fe2+ or Zn2+ uptake regulation protein
MSNNKLSRIELPQSILDSKSVLATKPRLSLLSILLNERRPLTVDQITKLSKEKIALSSLYRVIKDLRDSGIISEFQTPENIKVIELTTHQNEHHHHIFCSQCGAITDFEIDDRLERDLEKEIRKVELQYSVSVTSHSLELQSLCLECNKNILASST